MILLAVQVGELLHVEYLGYQSCLALPDERITIHPA